MSLIDDIAERKIAAAIEQGAFRNLRGSGQPLHLDDDRHVPQDLRAGYRLLKNSGYLPPELQLHADIHAVEDLLRHTTTPLEHSNASRRLQYLRIQLSRSRPGAALLALDAYASQVETRLDRSRTGTIGMKRE